MFYVMRFTAFLLLAVCLQCSAVALSQQITLSERNAPLKKVLKEMAAQAGVSVAYSENMMAATKPVTIDVKNATVEHVLEIALRDQPLRYTIDNGRILLNSRSGRAADSTLTATGRVTSEKGEPIPGASVLIKGTNIGTATGNDGRFEIKIPREAVTLIISAMGFQPMEITAQLHTNMEVRLKTGTKSLSEVVVMGFSEVERRHVASSVAQVDVKLTKTRPIAKLQEAFTGTVPGVTVQQTTNLPGSVPGITIRGISTLQNAGPLVIVDGMEQSLNDIDPNQVKSITVLKDAASASMYGSRGANGVIIIETERGQMGRFKVDVNSWGAIQRPIDLPKFVNGTDYMKLNNEARNFQGQTPLYNDEDIRKMESGETPSVDWLKEGMPRKANSQNLTMSVSGGGGIGSFNLMMGYLKENGLNSYEGSGKYSARFNTNVNIADKFVLLADFYAHRLQINRLKENDDGTGLYENLWKMNPTQQIYYPNSSIPEHYILYNDMNPIASINRGGSRNNLYDFSSVNLRPRYNISKHLSLEGNVSYQISKSANKRARETFKFFDGNGKPVKIWKNEVGADQDVSQSQLTARGLLNYTGSLRHQADKIYVTAGSEVMSFNYTDYKEITKASFFGKLNYSFDNRYILEFTARGDGSSKFAPGKQWGFFPAGAIAWNVTNEHFMKGMVNNRIINNLKLRASYGLIGNENVDPYLWEENVNEWGWLMRVPNLNFTWEKQKQGNIGIELTMLDNRLSVTAEAYKKNSYDLIYSRFPVPPITGSSSLEAAFNIGEVENNGYEISVQWQDKIGNLGYSIGAMLFDNRNKVLKAGYRDGDTLIFKDDNDKIWYKGIAIDNYYGYKSDGFFRDQRDVDNTPAKLPNTLPGDIKYIDQNGDGIINDADRINLGDPFPHLNYSINLGLTYKNWDFNLLGQGVGKRTGRLNGLEGYPILVDGSSNSLGRPQQYYADNRWTPETPNSRFPRVWTGSSTNAYLSDIWLGNAAFFRVKVLQLGYTFPLTGKMIRNVRVYVNAQDAITFTRWEGLEPERDGGSGNYPRMAVYSLGVRATLF
ncbi:SusC/RagA family TonB-linked outer membrane protein [Chitinophaga oryzae]|uniref:SusC/RagA family TonB-linked outer membrane protein n=2 Tax=Chitinophaga oryzae TaxID=2725414 RepID=A0AAE7D5H5_9BACT|nr:SusC/RagA family TonB-linked outer membrane protein [Chitinophaga oryzae]QJB37143.1 SusC/RagA family TonB-linked outer membrane protein [Chitinophaga oryzae]